MIRKISNFQFPISNFKHLGYGLFLLWAAFVFVKYVLVLLERGKLRSILP